MKTEGWSFIKGIFRIHYFRQSEIIPKKYISLCGKHRTKRAPAWIANPPENKTINHCTECWVARLTEHII